MPPVDEKRVESRFLARECEVWFESKRALGLLGRQTYSGGLVNISRSGIQVISKNRLKTQKIYDIVISGSLFRHHISGRGRVIWQKPFEGKDAKQYYRIGLKFTHLKGDAMERLYKLEVNPDLRKI